MFDIEKYPVTPPTICISEVPVVRVSPPPTALDTHLEENKLHQFPEGGIKAYLTVLGAFTALACTFGQLNAFGTFQAWYASHQLQHLPPSTISWIGSLQLWGATIGRLFDAYGPVGLMTAGTLCCLTSTMTTSACTEYYQYILSQSILFGLGVGLLFFPSLSSVSTHFSKYRGTALGLAIAGSSVGGIVYPIIFRTLFTKVGFGWGVRTSGLVSGVLCIMATLMVSSLFGRKKPGPYFDIKAIADARFALLAIGSTLVTLGLYMPYFYIVEYAKYLSIPDHLTFYVLSVMNSGAFLGRIAPAYFSDSIGRSILVPSAFFAGVSCLVFWLFVKSLVSLMLFSAIYGFLSGSFISLSNHSLWRKYRILQRLVLDLACCIAFFLFPSCCQWMLFTLNPIKEPHLAHVYFRSLLSGPTAGALLARYHGSFIGMIIFSGSTMVIGSFFLLASKLVEDSIFSLV